METAERPRVVVVGGGFGGLAAARALRRVPVDVTLIDQRNFHLFQPLLYQVATGALSPANIASPLRGILRRQKNVDVVLGRVTGFDVAKRRVILSDGEVPYDQLIVAAGATHSYFGNDWSALAPGLKTIEDATEMRSRILVAFERADREPDATRREALLNFVVVGAGPTGVELAGALAEISRHTLRHDFRHIEPEEARITLVDLADRVLQAFPPALSANAADALGKLGVRIRLGTRVADIRAGVASLECAGVREDIPCETILWAAGVQASPLGRLIAEQVDAPVDRAGRISVTERLDLAGHPEISLIGDLASFSHGLERPLPGIAAVAMQQGGYVADRIARQLAGRPVRAFRYRDRGTLATIGRGHAVADLGRFRATGLIAWLLWLFVHLLMLTQTANRLLVLLQWARSYLTHGRSARLITR